jgi:hypothetical protein
MEEDPRESREISTFEDENADTEQHHGRLYSINNDD